MPYQPTGRPSGRPRKEAPPAAKPAYVSGVAPVPFKAAPDTSPPVLGQRKRVKPRRAQLFPTPLKA